MMEEIIKKLIQRIKLSMPELMYVGEDCGQVTSSGEIQLPALPAVLVGCAGTEWSNLRGFAQKGNATFIVSLVTDCSSVANAGSDMFGYLQQRGLLRDKLHKLIQGYSAVDTATGLTRIASKSFMADQGIKVQEDTYTSTVTELTDEWTATNVEILKIHLSRTF